MTNPDKADSTEKTFDEKVSFALKEAKTDENNKLLFPAGTPEEVIYAAVSEKRRRDTQASYTKKTQELASVQSQNDLLVATVHKNVSLNITPEQQEDLEDLKHKDPEQWRKAIEKYEKDAKDEAENTLKEVLSEASKKGSNQAMIEMRTEQLKQFSLENPGIVLTDDIIQNDIPPRITKKLDTGEISFAEFLEAVKDFIERPKVIGDGQKILNQRNLSNTGGSELPTKNTDKAHYLTVYESTSL